MSNSTAAKLCLHASVATERVCARADRRPVVAVLSGAGDDNFGDEWMAEALRHGLPSCRLVQITHPATERRLARIGLSGQGLFSAVVISGGTLINAYFLPRALALLEDGLPAWTVGTGVGSAGFGVTEASAAPDGWVRHLQRFEEVAVRGPQSAARLSAVGFGGARAVGDLALAHVPAEPVRAAGSRRLLVNVSGTELEGMHGEGMPEKVVIDTVAEAIHRLTQDGWKPVPLAMHRDDLPRLNALGKLCGGWTDSTVAPRSATEARAAMTQTGAVVGMRLHAAALGWIHGVPTLGLAYRDKTLDFAAQIGAGDQIADLRSSSPTELRAAVGALVRRPFERAHGVHRQALVSCASLRSLMARIDARLANSQAS